MKIAIGSDHRGFDAKERIKAEIESLGHEVVDRGAHLAFFPADLSWDAALHRGRGLEFDRHLSQGVLGRCFHQCPAFPRFGLRR